MRSRKTYINKFPNRYEEMLNLIKCSQFNKLKIISNSILKYETKFHLNPKICGAERFWFYILTSGRTARLLNQKELITRFIDNRIQLFNKLNERVFTFDRSKLIIQNNLLNELEFEFNHNPYKFENCLFSRAKILDMDINKPYKIWFTNDSLRFNNHKLGCHVLLKLTDKGILFSHDSITGVHRSYLGDRLTRELLLGIIADSGVDINLIELIDDNNNLLWKN